MVIFNSYAKLPEGSLRGHHVFFLDVESRGAPNKKIGLIHHDKAQWGPLKPPKMPSG